MLVPSRHGSSDSYRYGFNGKEKDDEIKGGEGNSYDFGSRSIFDGRIGRFISIDPKIREYPSMSPYVYAANNPIYYEDQGGEGPSPFRFLSLLKKDSSYATGLIAGIGDGLLESGDMFMLSRHLDPMDLSIDGIIAKYEYYQMSKMAFTVMTDTDLQEKVLTSVTKELGIYWKQTTMQGTKAEGGYQHGKILFTILESTVGIGELQVLIKTGEFSENALKLIRKNASKIIARLKPCGCFTAGTQIYTESGYKNIEDIVIGDKVWAYSDVTKGVELKKVINTFKREFTQVYKIYFDNDILEATNEHPFFIDGKWLKVQDLKIGDNLTLYDGSVKPIINIILIEGNFTVYNFTVEDFHTYFVSKQNILVHNGNPCFVSYGQNALAHFKKHSGEMIQAARKIGVTLPTGPSKLATQIAFKDYIQKVVREGQSYVSTYMTQGDVIWTKLGDSIVIRKLDGEFVTHLTTATEKGKKTLQHFEEVVSKSTKAIPITN